MPIPVTVVRQCAVHGKAPISKDVAAQRQLVEAKAGRDARRCCGMLVAVDPGQQRVYAGPGDGARGNGDGKDANMPEEWKRLDVGKDEHPKERLHPSWHAGEHGRHQLLDDPGGHKLPKRASDIVWRKNIRLGEAQRTRGCL